MKNSFKFSDLLRPVTITSVLIIIILILYSLGGIGIFNYVELKTYDQRLHWREYRNASPMIVGAVLDEKSLDKEGRWPWPRNKIANLVNILSEDGAKVIGFDFFFTEPEQNSQLSLISKFEEKIDSFNLNNPKLKNFIVEEKLNTDNDLILAKAIRESASKVILPYFFHLSPESMGYELTEEQIEEKLRLIVDSEYKNIIAKENTGALQTSLSSNYISEPYAPEVNIEQLSREAAGSGYIDTDTGSLISDDGIIRDIPLTIHFRGHIFTPLAVQCVWHYLDCPNMILYYTDKTYSTLEKLSIGDIDIPVTELGEMVINYIKPSPAFLRYSITDILDKNFEKGAFRDKIVVVGSIAEGAHDLRHTPFSHVYPGMEVHMTAMDNILTKNFISKPNWMFAYDMMVIIIIGMLIGFIIPRSGAITGLSITAAIFIIYILLSSWLFSKYGLWVNMVYPLLTIVLLYTSLTAYHYLVEEQNKRFLHTTFASYLSPELIDNMVASNTMPELGGEARIITAFFTDIQGFSVFSEKLTAHQLVELLNEYLAAMTNILISENGTLDKYEGDAIIAFIGAPMNIPDHTLRACRVAIDMQGELLDLREKWKNERQRPDEPDRNIKNLPPDQWNSGDKWPRVVHEMMMRIGINSGEIVVGNMGSTMRMNYTMMGDSVNLAARLEAGAKQYGIYTAISEYTLNMEYINERGEKERAMDHVEARFIDNITVVGKTEPVKIYELCAMKGALTPKEKQLFDLFDRGMRYYLRMEWNHAIDLFEEALKYERFPDGKTTPSEVFIKRCSEFRENPPVPRGEKWDGVYRMTRK